MAQTLDIFAQDTNSSVVSLQLKRAQRFVESNIKPQELDSFKSRVNFILLSPTNQKILSFKFKRPFNSPYEFSEFKAWVKKLFLIFLL